jgi:predicted RNA methylase
MGEWVELQPDLFGEPARLPELSQLHTPLWLARRMAGWVHRGWRVLEPSFGSGNLIEGLIRAGHSRGSIHGVELDGRWVDFARARFEHRLHLMEGDFRYWVPRHVYDCVVMNPPFEENLHLEFVLRALELAHFVVTVVPVAFEFSARRDRELWSTRGVIGRRAILPERVKFAGEGGMFDAEVLMISRRQQRRRVGEVRTVYGETWLPDDLPEAA